MTARPRPLSLTANIGLPALANRASASLSPRRRKLITVSEPLFINYLFVELLDGQRWPPINSTYGINKLGTELRRIATWYTPVLSGSELDFGHFRTADRLGVAGHSSVTLFKMPLSMAAR